MNDDDLDELEGNGYQNVENDPFARRSSHHTQRRSQMPGRSPKSHLVQVCQELKEIPMQQLNLQMVKIYRIK